LVAMDFSFSYEEQAKPPPKPRVLQSAGFLSKDPLVRTEMDTVAAWRVVDLRQFGGAAWPDSAEREQLLMDLGERAGEDRQLQALVRVRSLASGAERPRVWEDEELRRALLACADATAQSEYLAQKEEPQDLRCIALGVLLHVMGAAENRAALLADPKARDVLMKAMKRTHGEDVNARAGLLFVGLLIEAVRTESIRDYEDFIKAFKAQVEAEQPPENREALFGAFWSASVSRSADVRKLWKHDSVREMLLEGARPEEDAPEAKAAALGALWSIAGDDDFDKERVWENEVARAAFVTVATADQRVDVRRTAMNALASFAAAPSLRETMWLEVCETDEEKEQKKEEARKAAEAAAKALALLREEDPEAADPSKRKMAGAPERFEAESFWIGMERWVRPPVEQGEVRPLLADMLLQGAEETQPVDVRISALRALVDLSWEEGIQTPMAWAGPPGVHTLLYRAYDDPSLEPRRRRYFRFAYNRIAPFAPEVFALAMVRDRLRRFLLPEYLWEPEPLWVEAMGIRKKQIPEASEEGEDTVLEEVVEAEPEVVEEERAVDEVVAEKEKVMEEAVGEEAAELAQAEEGAAQEGAAEAEADGGTEPEVTAQPPQAEEAPPEVTGQDGGADGESEEVCQHAECEEAQPRRWRCESQSSISSGYHYRVFDAVGGLCPVCLQEEGRDVQLEEAPPPKWTCTTSGCPFRTMTQSKFDANEGKCPVCLLEDHTAELLEVDEWQIQPELPECIDLGNVSKCIGARVRQPEAPDRRIGNVTRVEHGTFEVTVQWWDTTYDELETGEFSYIDESKQGDPAEVPIPSELEGLLVRSRHGRTGSVASAFRRSREAGERSVPLAVGVHWDPHVFPASELGSGGALVFIRNSDLRLASRSIMNYIVPSPSPPPPPPTPPVEVIEEPPPPPERMKGRCEFEEEEDYIKYIRGLFKNNGGQVGARVQFVDDVPFYGITKGMCGVIREWQKMEAFQVKWQGFETNWVDMLRCQLQETADKAFIWTEEVPEPNFVGGGGIAGPEVKDVATFEGAPVPVLRVWQMGMKAAPEHAAFTLMVKLRTKVSGRMQHFMEYGSEGGSRKALVLRLTETGNLEYGEHTGSLSSGWRCAQATPRMKLCDGNWHTVALVRQDTGFVWMYVDDELAGQGLIGADMPAGLSPSPRSYRWVKQDSVFHGDLGPLRVYGHELTINQVRAVNLLSGTPRFDT